MVVVVCGGSGLFVVVVVVVVVGSVIYIYNVIYIILNSSINVVLPLSTNITLQFFMLII